MADTLAGLPVLVYGGGELGTGVAQRFRRAGLRVLVAERAEATAVCRAIALAAAVHDGRAVVEDTVGIRADSILLAEEALEQGQVPVLVAPTAPMLARFGPRAVVDATEPRAEAEAFLPGTASITVRLGRGRTAEWTPTRWWTRRQPCPWARCSTPGAGAGPGADHVSHPVQSVRAPGNGVFVAETRIGEPVAEGALLGYLGQYRLEAPRAGFVLGLLTDGLMAYAGQRVAELWLGEDEAGCFAVSPWARAVAGGALEAVVRMVR